MLQTILLKFLFDASSLLIVGLLVADSLETLFFSALYLALILITGDYKSMLRDMDISDISRLLLISVGVFIIQSLSIGSVSEELLLFYSMSFFSLVLWRLMIYSYRNKTLPRALKLIKKKQTIIVGAGQATQIFLNLNTSTNNSYLGIFDDNESLKGRTKSGIKVLGTIKEIASFLEKHHVDRIIYMIPSTNINKHQKFFNIIQATYPLIEILTAPSLSDISYGLKNISELTNINLLTVNNEPKIISLSSSDLKALHNKTILVTGGGGSIGSVLVRQLLDLEPTSSVVVVEHSELAVYDLQEQCQDYIDARRLTVHLGDYADIIPLRSILKKHKPALVFHAAAYKHVNILEKHNIYSAFYNNCIKSIAFAEEIKKHAFIKTLLLVSTDKAVHPTNVMGRTKRIVESSLQELFHGTHVRFVITRFGNVVGSKGSVFHKFLRQIENRQKITLTDKSVTRYFMNITQAVNLIIQASLIGKASQVYVLNMGQPVLMYDFLVSMIKKYGTEEQLDDIVITGLRKGEKQTEELYYAHENIQSFDDNLFVGAFGDNNFQVEEFKAFFDSLEDTSDETALKKYIESLGIF